MADTSTSAVHNRHATTTVHILVSMVPPFVLAGMLACVVPAAIVLILRHVPVVSFDASVRATALATPALNTVTTIRKSATTASRCVMSGITITSRRFRTMSLATTHLSLFVRTTRSVTQSMPVDPDVCPTITRSV